MTACQRDSGTPSVLQSARAPHDRPRPAGQAACRVKGSGGDPARPSSAPGTAPDVKAQDVRVKLADLALPGGSVRDAEALSCRKKLAVVRNQRLNRRSLLSSVGTRVCRCLMTLAQVPRLDGMPGIQPCAVAAGRPRHGTGRDRPSMTRVAARCHLQGASVRTDPRARRSCFPVRAVLRATRGPKLPQERGA